VLSTLVPLIEAMADCKACICLEPVSAAERAAAGGVLGLVGELDVALSHTGNVVWFVLRSDWYLFRCRVVSRRRPRDSPILPSAWQRQFWKFLRRLDAEFPGGIALHLIQDNFAPHGPSGFEARLKRHPVSRSRLSRLGRAWLNLAERR
jgi:hypothetical protein